jgi:hypothetical protein
MAKAQETFEIKLTPFRKALEMTKAKIEELMIPLRVKQAKAKGEVEKLKLDEQIMSLEVKLREYTVETDINYNKILDALDELALLQRRKFMFDRVMSDLFDTEE